MLIEALIFEEESATLDFKRDAYVLTKAQGPDYEEGQAKLIKDLLAFANVTRRSDAYIVLGMEKPLGKRAGVYGIEAEIDDANVQQMVNSKLNRPIQFTYRNLTFEGKRVALIHLPTGQKRPIYLKKNVGNLIAETIYIRRGSSTAIANPEEIASFGAHDVERALQPSVDVAAIDASSGTTLADPILISAKPRIYPVESRISDFEVDGGQFDVAHIGMSHVNRDYYREFAQWDYQRTVAAGVSLRLTNISGTVAHDVNVKLTASDPERAIVLFDEDALKERPRKESPIAPYLSRSVASAVPARPPYAEAWMERAGEVHCLYISVTAGKLQPGEVLIMRDAFFIGSPLGGKRAIQFDGKLFADNLSEPKLLRFSFEIESHPHEVTGEEFAGITRPFVLRRDGKG